MGRGKSTNHYNSAAYCPIVHAEIIIIIIIIFVCYYQLTCKVVPAFQQSVNDILVHLTHVTYVYALLLCK